MINFTNLKIRTCSTQFSLSNEIYNDVLSCRNFWLHDYCNGITWFLHWINVICALVLHDSFIEFTGFLHWVYRIPGLDTKMRHDLEVYFHRDIKKIKLTIYSLCLQNSTHRFTIIFDKVYSYRIRKQLEKTIRFTGFYKYVYRIPVLD